MVESTLIEKTVQTLRERLLLPGLSVCLTDASGQDYITAAGRSPFKQETRLDPYAYQRVGSITKIVISTIILKLQEEGVLSLEQPVESFFPGVLKHGNRITIRQLLQHRSGLKDYIRTDVAGTKCIEHAVSSLQDIFPPQSLVRLIARDELEFEPGTQFKYSNTGYILLGMIAEKCSAKKIGELVDQWIIQPLHLERTYFPVTNEIRSPYATGHSKATADLSDLSDEVTEITKLNVSIIWTAGALISNPPEIQTFMKALFNGNLLLEGSLKEMMQFHETDEPKQAYGLGLHRYTFDEGVQALGHQGGIHGYESVTLYYPQYKTYMTVIVNQMPVGVVSIANQLFKKIFLFEL